ncbi:MAG: ParB/RepB/Spo0J family partition protein [Bdellovibrionota bacterium]
MVAEKKKALGRGLSALISSPAVPINKAMIDRGTRPVARAKAPSEKLRSDDGQTEVQFIDIDRIVNNPKQPRQHFEESELIELADSIRTLGVLQPIVVRPAANKPGSFEIVAGERRWRASQKAKLLQIPVIIKELDDRQTLEIAVVENVQRSNLTPLEEANAYQRLMNEFSLTQQEVAERVGKDRTTVSNFIRLLKLPEKVLELLTQSKITMGHAKAILTVKEPSAQASLAEKVVKENLSVRALEAIVSRVVVLDPTKRKKTSHSQNLGSAAFPEVCEKLRKALGTKVGIIHNKAGRGKIVIEYFSERELDRLADQLIGQ